MSSDAAHEWSERLLRLGLAVQRRVREHLLPHALSVSDALTVPTREAAGDRIYALDTAVESILEEEIAKWPADAFPLLLIAEGLGDTGMQRFGDPSQPLKYRVIVDPIDGTRMLMYDKRSAWFLAAVAVDRGDATSLADTFAAVMVELPPTKQTYADCFLAERGLPPRGLRLDLSLNSDEEELQSAVQPITVQPSTRTDLRDGFLTVVSYFPGIKALAADLAEAIASAVPQVSESPDIFDDQYISTGGQLVQLMTGRDRCCLDLRPLFAQLPQCRGRVLSAHPYDLAGLLVAEAAGVIVTDGFGRPIQSPLDVTSNVAWCGYANVGLQALVQPIVQSWLRKHGIE